MLKKASKVITLFLTLALIVGAIPASAEQVRVDLVPEEVTENFWNGNLEKTNTTLYGIFGGYRMTDTEWEGEELPEHLSMEAYVETTDYPYFRFYICIEFEDLGSSDEYITEQTVSPNTIVLRGHNSYETPSGSEAWVTSHLENDENTNAEIHMYFVRDDYGSFGWTADMTS